MWIDYKKYKHHQLLDELSVALQEDYKEWSQVYKPDRDGICVWRYEYADPTKVQLEKDPDNLLYEVPSNQQELDYRDAWWAIGLFFTRQFLASNKFPGYWLRAKTVLEKMPGLHQAVINFIVPNGIIPMHPDGGSWERICLDLERQVYGYTAVVCIDYPSEKVEEVGFRFAGEKHGRGFKTGDVFAFEGRFHEHEVWNYTDKWRVTCVIDIDESEWENVVG
jgi:hypothetical protein